MSGYQVTPGRDRDGMGEGIIEYVRRGVICRRRKDFETIISESICSELAISKEKWFCMCIYRPPNYNNLSTFFDEITLSLNKAALKFENFIVMGDFNIDVNASGPGKDKLDEFCNLFDLTNLVKEVTYCTNNHRLTIDLILANRPDSPLKKKIIRGNQAPFVNRELRKAIYTRSRLRNPPR